MSKRLATLKDKKFEVVKTLSFEEQADIEVMFRVINDFETQNIKFEIVRDIYEDILNTLENGTRGHQLFRQIMELMSTFNAFLNHWNTFLKREFGESSQNYIQFKKATGEQFDTYFEYRFLYGLRNYIHHCGMPNIVVNGKLDSNDIPVYQLMVNKAELLSGMDWHKRVKTEFQSMDVIFDIFPFFKVMLECVTRIHNVAIHNIDVVKLLICAQRMVTYKKYKGSEDIELVLLGYMGINKYGKPTNLNYEQFRFNLADHLIKQIKPINVPITTPPASLS